MSGRRPSGKAAARERALRLRAELLRADRLRAERRRRVMVAASAIGIVVVVILALVIVKASGLGDGDGGGTTGAASTQASAQVIRDVTSVPPATLDKVGVGTAKAIPKRIDAPPLTVDGKPKVLYVGADFCPFCAAERWPVVVAPSRFGTWSSLSATTSASEDVYPNTETLSFHGASYTSTYVVFTGVETRDNKLVNGQYEPLDKLSAADQKVFDTYDRPPYTNGSPGSIPFIDIGGGYVISGASYSPETLAGHSREEIAAALADPSNPIAQAVDGAANLITAAICEVTGSKPANVCTAPGVKVAAARLAKA